MGSQVELTENRRQNFLPLKWPLPKLLHPECLRASPRSDLDSPSKPPSDRRLRLLPRRPPSRSKRTSSPKPELTPLSTKPRPRLSLTTPELPRSTVTSTCQTSQSSPSSSESEVSTSSRQSQRRPFSSSDSDRSKTPSSSDSTRPASKCFESVIHSSRGATQPSRPSRT